jgi:peptidoglycan/xylan/chitin deacetylase (PgdA/CDA1 family)
MAQARLRLLPRPLRAVKLGMVRSRSLAWRVRPDRAGDAEPGLRILLYHRVSEDRDPLAVTPARFAQQMGLLAGRGWAVVDLVAAAGALARGTLPPRAVALTFDDGYRDVAEHAVPVLERHGFAATVFVVPGAIDGGAPFTWYAAPPPLLGWDDIVDLDWSSPLRFEAHSMTHPNLLTLDDAAARWEVGESRAVLERRLGRRVEAFCYPAGLFGARERELVAGAGYRIGVSCEPGMNTAATDLLALRRTQVEGWDTPLDVRAKLGGAHDRPLPLRGVNRRVRYGAPAPRVR